MTDPRKSITIENVVASTAVDQELDLGRLAEDLPTAEFDRARFPGLLFRTRDPKATTLIFRSGKIVTTGAKSEAAIDAVLEIVFEDLGELGIQRPDPPEVSVQNIVSVGDLGQSLNLNAIAIGLGLENIEYEPEQFPGLVYRLDDPPVVTLLFGTGKLVITGGKTADDAVLAVEAVQSRLNDFELLE